MPVYSMCVRLAMKAPTMGAALADMNRIISSVEWGDVEVSSETAIVKTAEDESDKSSGTVGDGNSETDS